MNPGSHARLVLNQCSWEPPGEALIAKPLYPNRMRGQSQEYPPLSLRVLRIEPDLGSICNRAPYRAARTSRDHPQRWQPIGKSAGREKLTAGLPAPPSNGGKLNPRERRHNSPVDRCECRPNRIGRRPGSYPPGLEGRSSRPQGRRAHPHTALISKGVP